MRRTIRRGHKVLPIDRKMVLLISGPSTHRASPFRSVEAAIRRNQEETVTRMEDAFLGLGGRAVIAAAADSRVSGYNCAGRAGAPRIG